MAEFLIDDEIDFAAYMTATDHDHKVVSTAAFADEVVAYFHDKTLPKGCMTPWRKMARVLRFRAGEVSLWTGINGHGKSLALGQTCVSLVAQRQKVCIASLEMKPVVTLARICRQALCARVPEADLIRYFHKTTDGWLWLYDQQGEVKADKMLALMRYCADKRGIQHFVLDSMLKCGIAEDDYNGQKKFIDGICTTARDTGMHIHIVAHSRKGRDESVPPGKMDVRGASAITDQVDNVLTVWRNKAKERARDESSEKYDVREPDALLLCDKQRNGEWEGRLQLWFEPDSQQYIESDIGGALDLFKPPRADE